MSLLRKGPVLWGSLLLAAAASLSACGESFVAETGGAGGGGGAGGAPASPSERFATAVCGQVFECCKPADLVELFSPSGVSDGSVTDYAGCRIYYRTSWEAIFEPFIQASVAAGRMEFDEAAFDDCLQTFASQPCADYLSTSPVCDEMFVPKVEAGGACTSELECKTGACEVPLGAAEGKCVEEKPPSQAGGGCAGTGDCAEELYCEFGKCTATKALGESCSADEQCRSRQCVGEHQGNGKCGKICEGGGSGPGTVDAALEAIGGPAVLAQCGWISKCCTPAESAELLVPGIDTEQECRTLVGVLVGYGLVAIHNSASENKVAVDEGALQKCLSELQKLSCGDPAEALALDCPEGIQGLLGEEESCSTDTECKTTYCNKPNSGPGTCAPVPGKDETCTTKCAEGTWCNAFKCAEQKPLGAECTSDAECKEGRCFAPSGGAQTCMAICDG